MGCLSMRAPAVLGRTQRVDLPFEGGVLGCRQKLNVFGIDASLIRAVWTTVVQLVSVRDLAAKFFVNHAMGTVPLVQYFPNAPITLSVNAVLPDPTPGLLVNDPPLCGPMDRLTPSALMAVDEPHVIPRADAPIVLRRFRDRRGLPATALAQTTRVWVHVRGRRPPGFGLEALCARSASRRSRPNRRPAIRAFDSLTLWHPNDLPTGLRVSPGRGRDSAARHLCCPNYTGFPGFSGVQL